MKYKLFNLGIGLFITLTAMSQNYNKLRAELDEYIKDEKSPGLQYLVLKDGKPIFEYNEGFADITNEIKIDKNTTFRAYSITKTFTALAIMQLAEQGKINLNDYASKYIPEYPFKYEVTIKQLLSHTAGMPNPFPKWIHYENAHSQFNQSEFAKSIINKHTKPKNKPGKKAKYENFSYILLGIIIENVSGQTYEAYITENIVNKLDTFNSYTGFDIPENNFAKGYNKIQILMVMIYKKNFGKELIMNKLDKWYELNNIYLNVNSYGGLISNTTYLGNYANKIYFENELISPKYKNELFTPAKLNNGKINEGKVFGKKISLCNGWMKSNIDSITYYSHPGSAAGYSNDLRIYPEQGIVTVIMMNRTGIPSDLKLLDKFDKYFIKK